MLKKILFMLAFFIMVIPGLSTFASSEECTPGSWPSTGVDWIDKLNDSPQLITIQAKHSGKYLIPQGDGIVQKAYNDNVKDNMKWYLTKRFNKYYLTNFVTGDNINAASTSQANLKPYEEVVQQQFELVIDEGGTFRIKSLNNNQFLDIYGSQQGDGARLILYPRNEDTANNQKFILTPIENPMYNIKIKHSGKYLAYSTARVVQRELVANYEYNYKWMIVKKGENHFIYTANNSIGIDAAYDNGIVRMTPLDHEGQSMKLIENLDGSYNIISNFNGNYLGVQDNSLENEAYIGHGPRSDSDNQKFIFIPIN